MVQGRIPRHRHRIDILEWIIARISVSVSWNAAFTAGRKALGHYIMHGEYSRDKILGHLSTAANAASLYTVEVCME